METNSGRRSSALHFLDVFLFICLKHSYEEGKRKIEAYSRSLAKYDLLSETQGYEKRVDGKPVNDYVIIHNW